MDAATGVATTEHMNLLIAYQPSASDSVLTLASCGCDILSNHTAGNDELKWAMKRPQGFDVRGSEIPSCTYLYVRAWEGGWWP